jgi:hypothetical protein
MPYAALAMQLPLPVRAALSGTKRFRAPGRAAFFSALAGAGLGLAYGFMTRDAVFTVAEAFAVAAFVAIRRKPGSLPRKG